LYQNPSRDRALPKRGKQDAVFYVKEISTARKDCLDFFILIISVFLEA
jgi:hypothetical protein